MEPPSEKTVNQDANQAINALEALGYKQELHRSFSLLGMIGFSFSIVTCWTALSGTFTVGISSGGPPVMVWSWIGVTVAALAVALSFAEFCTIFPLSGGQYSWVAALAPPSWARGLSWVTGWFMLIGLVGVSAVNNFICAGFILGMANLVNPEYVIERWHNVLVTYLVCLFFGGVNTFAPRLFNGLSMFLLVLNIVSFLSVTITLVATCKSYSTPHFVFSEFRNETGLSPALGTIAGLLQSFYGMCCYESPAHMVEEMRNPTRDAPVAIVSSVILGGVTGFVFLVACFFCVGDYDSVVSTSTGSPVIQILYNSTESKAGTCILATLITTICLFAANSLMAETSRSIYAFSRDHGLPFSKTFSKIHAKFQVPVAGILLAMVCQAILNTIYVGSYTGFNTVASIATEGFYVSYLLPILARLVSQLGYGHKFQWHPKYNLGRWSIPINVFAALFLSFASITFNFPSAGPVTGDNFNYCSAAVGAIMAISTLAWIMDGRKNFTIPNFSRVIDAHERGSPSPEGSIAAVGNEAEKLRTSGL
ncbi:putative GABA permease [Xylariaceae sp. FL1272]|nr:putative GABA permease [Xylariaceae sp. FL1272]